MEKTEYIGKIETKPADVLQKPEALENASSDSKKSLAKRGLPLKLPFKLS